MTDPDRATSGGPDPRAEHADAFGAGGESSRVEPSPDQSAVRYENPEAALGGADAVEKTTYVVGEGTEPDARPAGDHAARAAASGRSVTAWVVGGIAAIIALVYALGIFS